MPYNNSEVTVLSYNPTYAMSKDVENISQQGMMEYLNYEPDSAKFNLERVVNPILNFDNGVKYTKFTLELFRKYPHLFENNGTNVASNLLYILCAGVTYNEEMLMQLIINIVNRTTPLTCERYNKNDDLMLMWAMEMYRSRKTIIYEPVMTNLSKVFNNWLLNPIVVYQGRQHNISIFRPLCYSKSGQNFIFLLPYLFYIFTFFNSCNPYQFEEEYTSSSISGFRMALEERFAAYYQRLMKEYNIMEDITLNIDSLNHIDQQYLIKMFIEMLDQDQLITIRNNELNKTNDLLNGQTAQQNILIDTIMRHWGVMIEHVMSTIVNNSIYVKIINALPSFQPNVISERDLILMTGYCISGGDCSFGIDENMYYCGVLDEKHVRTYHSDVVQPPLFPSNITTATHIEHRPFTNGDVGLNMLLAYLYRKFKLDRGNYDLLTDLSEKMCTPMFSNEIFEVIKPLFVNAVWLRDSRFMSDLTNMLYGNNSTSTLRYEFDDVNDLHTSLLTIFPEHTYINIVVPLYMYWFIPMALYSNIYTNHSTLETVPLTTVSFMKMFDKIPVQEKVIIKIVNMMTSVCQIKYSQIYCHYINEGIKEFETIISANPHIFQVYAKDVNNDTLNETDSESSLIDNRFISAYLIGGIELYNTSIISNPLVRGYYWVKNVLGTCDNLERFNIYFRDIVDVKTFERWIEYKDDPEKLLNLILSYFKLYSKTLSNKPARCLSDYKVTSNELVREPVSNVAYLESSDGMSIVHTVLKYTMPKNDIMTLGNNISIITRNIMTSGTGFIANKPEVNQFVYINQDGEQIIPFCEVQSSSVDRNIPTYKAKGMFETKMVSIVNPPGTRELSLELFTDQTEKNDLIMIFTPVGLNYSVPW